MAKYEGNCFICGKTAGRTALKNHVLKEHNDGNEQCYLIRAESIYQGSPYWLFFTVPVNAELDDIDDFLRSIWLDCCGHLSAFEDGHEEYPMSMKLNRFAIGDKIGYDYDFGTTTELLITFLDKTSRPKQAERVQLLARNIPVEKKCSACDRVAAYADSIGWEETLACESCYEKEESDETYYLPITNSPRSGECAYEGFTDIWTFDPEGDFPQPVDFPHPVVKRKQVASKEQPKNIIHLNSNDTLPSFDDDMDFEYVYDLDDEFDLDDAFIPIEEIKAAGELDLYLRDLESFEGIPEYIIAMAYEYEPDKLQSLSEFFDFTVEELDKLTDEEKQDYDLSAVYKTHKKLTRVTSNEFSFSDLDFDDFKNDLELKTIEEIKEDGELEDFLQFCENFEPLPEEVLTALIDEGQIKILEITCETIMFTIDQLEKLSDDERAGYDFATIYEARETIVELINSSIFALGKKAGIENFTIPKPAKPPRQAAKNVVNLFGESVHPTAEEKWNKLSDDFKEKVLNNTYCIRCGISQIKDFTIHQEPIGIVLRGKCTECDSKVVRAIEEV